MNGNAHKKERTPSMSGLLTNTNTKGTLDVPVKHVDNRNAIQKALAQRFMVDPANSSQKYMESIQLSFLKEQAKADHDASLSSNLGKKAKEAVFHYNHQTLVYESKSFGVFDEESQIRRYLFEMIMNPIYKTAFIILVIAYSSVLAIEKNIKSKETLDNLHYFLLAMNFCFLFDTIAKTIVMGLYQNKNSYLRHLFYALDAFIVIIGQVLLNFQSFIKFIVYFSESELGLQIINIIITLRCAGLIQGNQTSKKLTLTLLKAIPDLMIAISFLWFVFLIYAIMGLYLFSDSQYGRCRLTEKPVNATFWEINSADWCGTGTYVCPEGTYCGHGYKYGMTLEDDHFSHDRGINFDITNFNNVGTALFTTYQAMTFDGSTLHMHGHMRSANRLVSAVFFISLMLIGHFYLYSLVSAVVIAAFQKKHSISSHSQEEIMILIKYSVAKYFQRKDPKVGSVFEEESVKESNLISVTNRNANSSSKAMALKSTLNHIDNSNEKDKNNKQPNITTIEQENWLDNQDISPNSRNLQDQKRGLKNKTPIKLNKNLPGSHIQGTQGSQERPSFNEQTNKSQGPEEAKLESKKSKHIINEINYDGEERKVENNTPKGENKNLVEVKGIGKPIISLRESKSSSITGNKRMSVKVTPLQPEGENPKVEKLIGGFLKRKVLEEKILAIKQKESQRILKQRSKDNRCVQVFQKLAISKKFNFLVQSFVLANIVLLSLDRYPLSLKEGRDHDIASMIFSIFFLLEMLVKIVGIGPSMYFRDVFHWFDCLIVLISIFDVSFFFVPWIDQRKMKPLRTIRMIRLFKLLGSWKPIGEILKTIVKTIIDIGPFSIIMVVFFYIASLIGMNLFFQRVRLDHHETPSATEGGFADANFNNLFEGSLIVYILFENDGWSMIFFQHAQATKMIYTSCIYFIIILHFAQLVILNLFLTILLEHFESDSQEHAKKEEEDEESEKKIKLFQEEQKKLQEIIESQMDPVDMHNMRMERFQAKFKNKSKVEAISDDLAKKYLFGKSLFLFSVHNPVRKFCHKLIYHAWFEKLVVAVISAANVAMCFENPLLDEKSPRQITLDILTYFFAGFFTIEAILKIFVQGFVFNGHFSYLKSYQNIADLLVVVLSLIQLGVGHKARLLLLFRIIRIPIPLNMAASGEGLKIALESLVMSMKVIGEAITILFLFFLIFAIIFVNLLKGKLNKCTDAQGHHDVYENIQQCYNYGGVWESYMYTYDSVPKALINLFNSATRVGYSEMMYWSAKTTKVGGTVEHYHKEFVVHEVIMIIFMLTCSIFILSVFVGMIVSAFNREEERISKRNLLTDFQIKWVRLLEEVMKIRPIKSIESDSKLRLWLEKVLKSKAFLNFITVMIFFHSVVLALKQFDQEEVFARTVESLDHAFTALFVFECLIKLAVLRSHYFHAPWSYLDLLMAALGLTNIINAFIYQDVEPMWVIVIKALRIIRVFQLTEKIEAVKTLITSIRRSGPAIMNLGSLMILSYVFFSVLGVNLFATVRPQWPLDHDIVNFKSVDNAFLILFRATCGENWHFIEYGISRGKTLKCQCDDHFSYEKYEKEGEPNQCGNIYLSTFYFLIFHLFLSEAFVDLFIGVILRTYKVVLQSQEATINYSHLLNYQRVWLKYDPIGRGFISKNDLSKFLLDLKSPLGLEPEDWNGHDLPFSYMSSLELSLYNDLKDIQFYNLLERLARKALIDDMIAQDIEKMDKEKSFDHTKIDGFLKKFETYSTQINTLEENKIKIHIVTEVQKVKKKYQGVGMFKIITWREQQSLIKMTRTVKNRYDMLHGKAQNQKLGEKKQQDNNKKPSAQKFEHEKDRTNKVLNQLDEQQELINREQEHQLERLMDSIVKEQNGEKEEQKQLGKLGVAQRANTNQVQNKSINPKDRYIESKKSTKTMLHGTDASADFNKMKAQNTGLAQKQPKGKKENQDNVSDQKSEVSRKSLTIDPQKEVDIDFQSEGGREKREQVEEKKGIKSLKTVIPKDQQNFNKNIDQLEAEVAAILESEESERHLFDQEMLGEIQYDAKQGAQHQRTQKTNELTTQDVKPGARTARKL